MDILHAIVLGIVQGVTEFLPVSSTGHLTIVSQLLGYPIDDAGVTAFIAVIQLGSIIAVIAYFAADIWRLATAWVAGLFHAPARTSPQWREAWIVIIGSIPVGLAGFFLRNVITGPLRSLWVVAAGLLLWSLVMWLAERLGSKARSQDDASYADALVIGTLQCFALVPGVSRSGATISAGLMRGLDRVAATRISFLLSIPALVGAGGFQAIDSAADISASVGWTATLVATVVTLLVSWLAIAWLLKFVAGHSIAVFIWYRVALALVLAALLITGVLTAV